MGGQGADRAPRNPSKLPLVLDDSPITRPPAPLSVHTATICRGALKWH
jgi:hypothetical protein